jgi:hypothetical protein
MRFVGHPDANAGPDEKGRGSPDQSGRHIGPMGLAGAEDHEPAHIDKSREQDCAQAEKCNSSWMDRGQVGACGTIAEDQNDLGKQAAQNESEDVVPARPGAQRYSKGEQDGGSQNSGDRRCGLFLGAAARDFHPAIIADRCGRVDSRPARRRPTRVSWAGMKKALRDSQALSTEDRQDHSAAASLPCCR